MAAQPAGGEKEVWSLEDTYWRYVQTNDLERYRTLWHSDFLGWPLTNPEPTRKEHITDWITAHTSKAETLKSYDLERLAAQATGDYVTVAYRIHTTWVDKDGVDKTSTTRIVHTWLHNPDHQWQSFRVWTHLLMRRDTRTRPAPARRSVGRSGSSHRRHLA